MAKPTSHTPFHCDLLIAGAGISGATAARCLAEAGARVLVVEQRNHIAGNCYDEYDPYGVLIHRYGPHIFHTNSKQAWDFLSRFTDWHLYQHRVRAFVDGLLVPMPINLDTLEMLYNTRFNAETMGAFLKQRATPIERPANSQEVVVGKVGKELYEKFFRHYTFKQWGREADELAPEVCARIPIRFNRDDRYFADTFQGMPKQGYSRMIAAMLDHPGIALMLQTPFQEIDRFISRDHTIFTGPVDGYFNNSLGKLPYRGIRFVFEYHEQQRFQQWPVINYPGNYDFTRITEYTQLTQQRHHGTTISLEYPVESSTDRDDIVPCYPMPTAEAQELYQSYAELASGHDRLHFLGRLGRYRYLNMDQAVLEAIDLATRIAG